MFEFVYTVKDPVGIHARPAGMLSKEGKKYKSTITVDKDGNPDGRECRRDPSRYK